MAEDTEIAWTDSTFNSWWGCSRVSPGCENCYAEAWDKRTGGGHWGNGKARRVMSDQYWRQPLKWNKKAAKEGKRHRVFCSSMADVFDDEAPAGQRERLWELIRQTPCLDWQILTKRPQNMLKYLPSDWGNGYPNVWLGVTAEDQKRADERIPILLDVPAQVRFVSAEPLLGDVNLWAYLKGEIRDESLVALNSPPMPGIDWVIIGGESGPGARAMNIQWARDLAEQCKAAGVKVFMKQLGAAPFKTMRSVSLTGIGAMDHPMQLRLNHKKGGDIKEFPPDLQVREFPR